jgi:hypothetical protein
MCVVGLNVGVLFRNVTLGQFIDFILGSSEYAYASEN